jgi:heme/copper-type cytochrome/quinol oxidase subunit 2
MDNSTRLIDKIKSEQVKPLPRWRFTFKNTLIWIAFIVCVLFGALAFSVILFALQQADFNITRHMNHSVFELLLILVPLFWLVSLIILLISAMISLKNSKKGYRFTSPSLIGYSTALSILLGTLFFISGGAGWLEHAFASNVNAYESIEERKSQVWSNPEGGFLSGTIISVSESVFELQDLQGGTWDIDYSGADIVPAVQLMDGEKIKMTGEMTSASKFKADIIRPWGGFQNRHHGGRKK